MKPYILSSGKIGSAALLCGFSLLLTVSGCGNNELKSASGEADSEEFDVFLEDLFCSEITGNTINLHYTLSHPENYGITEIPITLGDLSEEALLASAASLENTKASLEKFPYSSLSGKQQLTYDLLEDYLDTQISVADLTYYDEILRPSTGVQAELPVLYEEYRFHSESDIDDYLALIGLTGDYFDQIIAFEQKKADAGLFMSDFACNTIISQCRDFAAKKDDHYLVETFNNKIDRMEGLSDEEIDNYKLQNESLVTEVVIPAYETLATALESLLGTGTNDKGLCYFADGSRYYEYLVYYNTGCSSDISDIANMIRNQRTDDLAEAAELTKKYPDLWEECTDAALNNTDAATTVSKLQEAMLDAFPAAPDTRFTVSYIDECMEDYLAPAFYITSPIDDYTDNSIFINQSTDTSTVEYFTTLAHEGYPGHLYQTVMSYEAGLADVRNLFNYPGYVEGWATYVEMLSYYYTGLDDNVASMLQHNQSAILSLYASTDIGIHHDGWSYDDTVTFWNGYGITADDTIRDIYELIVEEPAHYLKYYVGYLEFLELKKMAQKKYLLHYDDVAFHRAILEIGPAPFDIIEKYFADYYTTSEETDTHPAY